jgi:DGQHR domain-containing protein
VYACVLDLPALNTRLPDRLDDKVVKDANRQLTPSHARRIQTYLSERDDWVLSTLMLGVPAEAVEFRPYVEDDGAPMQVGELHIHAEYPAAMKMFDGQHRRRAIKDVIRELELDRRMSSKLSALQACSLPIMLYVEDDIDALQQMFADAAQTKTIERNVVARFDLRDPFNLAALWLEDNSNLFAGRVELERASVPRTSNNIIAINQLSATLKTVEVGYKGRVSKDLSDQYMLALDQLYERCCTWADDFMPTARDEYEGLIAGDIDNSEIPQTRATSLAYNATVIRLFAGCYYEWTKDGADWKPLAEFIQGAFLEPGSGQGALLVDAGLVAEGGITPFARAQLVSSAIEYIVNQAKAACS